MHSVRTRFWAVRDYLAPVLRDSKFKEHGRITPDEFVHAGDYLVERIPAWQWCAGDSQRVRDYLPADKQFLLIRGVPCLRRVSHVKERKRRSRLPLSRNSSSTSLSRLDVNARKHRGLSDDTESILHLDEFGTDESEDWIVTHTETSDPMDASLRDMSARLTLLSLPEGQSASEPSSRPMSSIMDEESEILATNAPTQAVHGRHTESDADLLNSFAQDMEEREDPAQYIPSAPAKQPVQDLSLKPLVSVRTYDCMITYDKYYQTPRMWLLGYDEHGLPLRPSAIFEDVASDHAYKTVTIEPFPHGIPGTSILDTIAPSEATGTRFTSKSLSVHVASIHPCKHASMMRKMIQRMNTVHERDEEPEKLATYDTSLERPNGSLWSQTVHRVWGPKSQDWEDGITVDQYLIIFLKFMTSIVPTIDIDTTRSS